MMYEAFREEEMTAARLRLGALVVLFGGLALRWKRAVLFAFVAGIYGVFIGLAVEPFSPVLGLIPAAVLSFLGYQTLNRKLPNTV